MKKALMLRSHERSKTTRNAMKIAWFFMHYLNPTLHGIKNVAGDTEGGHDGHPLENDTRDHFCGQIDL